MHKIPLYGIACGTRTIEFQAQTPRPAGRGYSDQPTQVEQDEAGLARVRALLA